MFIGEFKKHTVSTVKLRGKPRKSNLGCFCIEVAGCVGLCGKYIRNGRVEHTWLGGAHISFGFSAIILTVPTHTIPIFLHTTCVNNASLWHDSFDKKSHMERICHKLLFSPNVVGRLHAARPE